MTIRLLSSASLAAAVLAAMPMLAASSSAQAAVSGRQIVSPIDDSARVTLVGNTRPEARNVKNDRGAVSDSLSLPHMQLLLKRSPAQEKSLQTLIGQLHDKSSPNFHHWLTANEFGGEFGPAGADVKAVTGWLKSHGFQVNVVYSNQMMIDFSGTAGQVKTAFKTEIHNIVVKGAAHIANISDPQIPSAMAPAVAGVVSLNNFRPTPMLKKKLPKYTFQYNNITYNAVVPYDLEKIYNMNPLYSEGISGQGQTVVVVEDTNVYAMSDWSKFRSAFGLTGYTQGSFTQVHPSARAGSNCANPGVNGDDVEAIIDAEYASAAAPSAHIELASCANTFTFGGFIALQNMLDAPNPPGIVSISYGQCEAYDGASFNAYIYDLYEQAVSEGTSVFVSSGDEDAASCDADQAESWQGIAISGWTSTPFNVSVGGTDFGDSFANTNSSYWSATNNASYGSALSYVPEIPWNDSCASTLLAQYITGSPITYGSTGFCNTPTGQEFWEVGGGSGGPSGCAYGTTSSSAAAVSGTCSGYAKPDYQTGFKGNPADGVRDIPDVSLFAANGLWGHFYVICYSDPAGDGVPCSGSPSNWPGYGGTSFASPILAAVQALINQKTGTVWGNPNYVYYSLAEAQYTNGHTDKCNSTLGNGVDPTCVFYDVRQGDMDVNCTTAQNLGLTNYGLTYLGPVNCYIPSGYMGVLSTSNNSYKPAYGTGTGWDFSTGIGTVNVTNLANAWPVGP